MARAAQDGAGAPLVHAAGLAAVSRAGARRLASARHAHPLGALATDRPGAAPPLPTHHPRERHQRPTNTLTPIAVTTSPPPSAHRATAQAGDYKAEWSGRPDDTRFVHGVRRPPIWARTNTYTGKRHLTDGVGELAEVPSRRRRPSHVPSPHRLSPPRVCSPTLDTQVTGPQKWKGMHHAYTGVQPRRGGPGGGAAGQLKLLGHSASAPFATTKPGITFGGSKHPAFSKRAHPLGYATHAARSAHKFNALNDWRARHALEPMPQHACGAHASSRRCLCWTLRA